MKRILLLLIIVCAVKAEAQQVPGTFKATWIANTYGKGGPASSANHPWVQNYIDCMYVTEDGTCYTTSIWDEGGRRYGVYKDGKVLGNNNQNINCSDAGGFGISGNNVTGNGLTITGIGIPTALAMGRGSYEGKLLVADNGPRKQILIYDVSGEEAFLEEILGVEGGVGADFTASYNFPEAIHSKAFPAGHYPPGIYHPLKFWTLTGVGMDTLGRVFVSTSELGSSIRCFKKNENNNWILDWKLENFSFVDNGDFDRTTSGIDIYTVQERFSLDYSKEAQGAEWSIKSITVDEVKYPNDPRALLKIKAEHEHGLTSSIIRYINGKRFLFVNGMTCQWTWIFRFVEGTDIAVPSVCISNRHRIYDIKPDEFWPPNIPDDGRQYIWRDANGDADYQVEEFTPTSFGHTQAWHIDREGGIWGAKGNVIHRYNPEGIDESGNPVYNDDNTETFTITGISQVGKIIWQAEYDRLVLLSKGCRELKGGNVFIVNNFSEGNREAEYLTGLKGDNPSSIDAAGEYLFEVGWETRGKCWVTDLGTGQTVGTMEPYGDAGATAYTGWVDIGFGITAYERPNGEYLVLVEEDGWGKILLYRWCPSGDCIENCTTEVDSLVLKTDTLNLDGLQAAMINVSIYPDTVCDKKVVWNSSNTSVATIDYKGQVTTRGEGNTWIKVISVQQPGITDSCLVIVNDVPLEHIEFEKDTIQLPVSRTEKAGVFFYPSNALNRKLSWESTGDSIVSVDEEGNISALYEGTSYIIVVSESGGFTDTCFIEVIPVPVQSIVFPENKLTLWKGDQKQPVVEILPADAANKEILFEIRDTVIASVNATGLVTGKRPGETYLVAISLSNGVSDSCIVNVLSDHEFANMDIGPVCAMGSMMVKADTVFEITASGSDIWNESDEFHFAYKIKEGNQLIIARVLSLENTNEWAKAGVMIRETTGPASRHAMMVLTPGNGSSFQRRYIDNGPSDHTTPGDGKKAPYWVKLIREGNLFSGYISGNGRNWTKVGETHIEMPESIKIGLCLTSHNSCVINKAVFDNIVLTSNIDTILPIPSNDARLNDLRINGMTIDGFNPGIYSYSVEINPDHSEVPWIEADAEDSNAEVIVTQLTNLSGEATVSVVAEDGTTKLTYIINFISASYSGLTLLPDVSIYPNPADDYIMFQLASAESASMNVYIYDITGNLRIAKKGLVLKGEESIIINISTLEGGIYFIDTGNPEGSYYKLIVAAGQSKKSH